MTTIALETTGTGIVDAVTAAEAKALGLRQQTFWRRATDAIDCQYGNVPVIVWLQLEVERIERKPSRRAALVRRGDDVALFCDEPPKEPRVPLGRLHPPGPPKMPKWMREAKSGRC